MPHTQEERAAVLRMMPNWNLEELTIRNANPTKNDIPFHGFLRDVLFDESAPIYKLSLRSLTLEGFDMRQYAAWDDEPGEIKSVLYHLFRRLPLLERVRISPDHTKIREPSPLPVREIIRATCFQLSHQGWLSPPWRLSKKLKLFCPHLRAIDLSHQRELDDIDWEDLLKRYAPQLESLVCWSVSRMDCRALRHLVPASPGVVLKKGPHPSQKWAGLQELDINANRKCASVVHLFLKYVPTLRILRALGVPVDGAGLLGSDWACKDMEVLAINIMVPTRVRARVLNPWCWNSWSHEWDSTPQVKDKSKADLREWLTGGGKSILGVSKKLDSSDQPRMGRYVDAESEESEDEYCYAAELWEKRVSADAIKARERKRERIWDSNHITLEDEKFLRWCEQQDTLEEEAHSEAMAQWRRRKNGIKAEKDRRNKEYNIQTQQQLCQQLGRLVKLKELTLEGPYYPGGARKKSAKFDCLHLTLETGLDYLRPLQANLEKLVVYRLGEGLSGGAEVEWIAKNWVHHRDPVWQHTFDTWDRQSYLEIPDEDEGGNRVRNPPSKFRQLIGVHTQKREGLDAASAAGNIAWLEYYCPELVVVRDKTKAPTAKELDNSDSYDSSSDYSDSYDSSSDYSDSDDSDY